MPPADGPPTKLDAQATADIGPADWPPEAKPLPPAALPDEARPLEPAAVRPALPEPAPTKSPADPTEPPDPTTKFEPVPKPRSAEPAPWLTATAEAEPAKLPGPAVKLGRPSIPEVPSRLLVQQTQPRLSLRRPGRT